MSVFSVGPGDANFYNMLFNSVNGQGGSGLLSGGSSLLGDYSLIKSGAYKKLLNAYYDKVVKPAYGDDDDDEKGVVGDRDSLGGLSETKSDAQSLQDSISALSDGKLYEKKADEDGNLSYDRDKIEGAVKDYVKSYNAFLDSAGDLDSTAILSKTLNIVQATSKNSKLLGDIGISIGADNKLVIDEDKLKEADVSAIKSLFKGTGSYGQTVAGKAAQVYSMANSMLYSGRHASSYTFDGAYRTFGTGNSFSFDEYL